MLKNFRCYQSAISLYDDCKTVSVPIYLKDQLLRAASSIVLNLAEGSARQSAKERRRFYNIALASLREVQSILDLEARNRTELIEKADNLAGGVYRLCNRQ